MKLIKVAGATSEIWQIFIQDSSSTTGAGITALTNASSGLTAYYHRDTDTTATAITLASMTVGTFTSSGFKKIDDTNMPGWYQFCPPNAALASGAKSCAFWLGGATNMAPLPIECQLTAVNPDSATAFITGVNSIAPPTNWNLLSVDASGRVDVIKIAGTSQTARDIGASVLLSSGTGTGQLDFTSGVTKANATQWLGGTIPAVSVTGVPLVDAKYLLGTIFATPATAGVLDANAKNINNVATTSVTTINANQGTTQPVNFTGTGASALAKSDVVDIAGAAVSASTAQLGVNVVNFGGAAGTFSSGIPSVNSSQFGGQTVTAGAGVTMPATVASTTNITAGTITTVTNLTNAATSGDFTATMKTSLNAATPASVVGAVGSVTGNMGGNVTGSVGSVVGAVGSVTGAVGSVTGNVGGNVVGTVASVVGAVGSISGVTFPTNFGSQSIDTNGRVKALVGVTKNVALANFEFFMTDSTTHAPKTGLINSDFTKQVSLDGGAFSALSGTVTEIASGMYKVSFIAGETNGAVVTWRFAASGADDLDLTVVTSQ